MRTVFEEEEEEIASPDQQDREVTISGTTLLAIFFGLVLICGLFFGLGYTVGRRTSSEAGQSTATEASTPNSALQPAQNAPKPSAASQPVNSPAPVPDDAQAADATGSTTTDEPQDVSNQPKTAVAAPVNTAPSQVKPAFVLPAQQATAPAPHAPAVVTAALPTSTASAAPGIAVAAPAAGIVVQIAAISNPNDANVLVSALRKRGYSVTAHRFPGDPLIHVQTGPFSSRAEAIAMKQKLLGDGYNAFLK
jgi:cell division septation protein DedD